MRASARPTAVGPPRQGADWGASTDGSACGRRLGGRTCAAGLSAVRAVSPRRRRSARLAAGSSCGGADGGDRDDLGGRGGRMRASARPTAVGPPRQGADWGASTDGSACGRRLGGRTCAAGLSAVRAVSPRRRRSARLAAGSSCGEADGGDRDDLGGRGGRMRASARPTAVGSTGRALTGSRGEARPARRLLAARSRAGKGRCGAVSPGCPSRRRRGLP